MYSFLQYFANSTCACFRSLQRQYNTIFAIYYCIGTIYCHHNTHLPIHINESKQLQLTFISPQIFCLWWSGRGCNCGTLNSRLPGSEIRVDGHRKQLNKVIVRQHKPYITFCTHLLTNPHKLF